MFFSVACQKEEDISSILQRNHDLAAFITKNPDYMIEDQKRISPQEMEQLQQNNDELAQWYQKVPIASYSQITIKNKEGNGFVVLINKRQEVERILGLISVSI